MTAEQNLDPIRLKNKKRKHEPYQQSACQYANNAFLN
jgi:hypothetical protein